MHCHFTWTAVAAPMIVGENYCRSVEFQGFLDDFTPVHRSSVYRSAKQFDVLNQPMPVVQEQRREHLMLEAREFGLPVILTVTGEVNAVPFLIFSSIAGVFVGVLPVLGGPLRP